MRTLDVDFSPAGPTILLDDASSASHAYASARSSYAAYACSAAASSSYSVMLSFICIVISLVSSLYNAACTSHLMRSHVTHAAAMQSYLPTHDCMHTLHEHCRADCINSCASVQLRIHLHAYLCLTALHMHLHLHNTT